MKGYGAKYQYISFLGFSTAKVLKSLALYLENYSSGTYVKHHGIGKQIARNKDELKRQVLSRLHSFQKLPEKVKNLFKAPSVQYTLIDLQKSAI